MGGDNGYRQLFGRDELALATFLRSLRSFEDQLRGMLAAKADFTLRFEVRGNQGRVIHCRVNSDGFERPIDQKAEKSA